MLGQHINFVLILIGVQLKFDLGQNLVGEGCAYYEVGMVGGAVQIDQAILG